MKTLRNSLMRAGEFLFAGGEALQQGFEQSSGCRMKDAGVALQACLKDVSNQELLDLIYNNGPVMTRLREDVRLSRLAGEDWGRPDDMLQHLGSMLPKKVFLDRPARENLEGFFLQRFDRVWPTHPHASSYPVLLNLVTPAKLTPEAMAGHTFKSLTTLNNMSVEVVYDRATNTFKYVAIQTDGSENQVTTTAVLELTRGGFYSAAEDFKLTIDVEVFNVVENVTYGTKRITTPHGWGDAQVLEHVDVDYCNDLLSYVDVTAFIDGARTLDSQLFLHPDEFINDSNFDEVAFRKALREEFSRTPAQEGFIKGYGDSNRVDLHHAEYAEKHFTQGDFGILWHVRITKQLMAYGHDDKFVGLVGVAYGEAMNFTHGEVGDKRILMSGGAYRRIIQQLRKHRSKHFGEGTSSPETA